MGWVGAEPAARFRDHRGTEARNGRRGRRTEQAAGRRLLLTHKPPAIAHMRVVPAIMARIMAAMAARMTPAGHMRMPLMGMAGRDMVPRMAGMAMMTGLMVVRSSQGRRRE